VGHTQFITSIILHGENLISAGMDKNIIFWDVNKDTLRNTISKHSDQIHGITESDSFLISTAKDGQILVIDLNTQETVRNLKDIQSFNCVSATKNLIFAGALDGNVYGWKFLSV